MKINRNNLNKKVKKSSILKSKVGKKLIEIAIGGTVVLTLFSQLTNIKPNEITPREEYTISQINPDKIEINDDTYSITYSNLEVLDGVVLPNDITDLDLRSNLLHDISGIKNTDKIEWLDIENNSIDSIDLSKYPSLENLRIEGNYNLYTEDLVKYCESKNIFLDISMNDVNNVEVIKGYLNQLDIADKSDLEKERIIYKFVLDHMEYDKTALKDDNLAYKYNDEVLESAISGKGVCTNYCALFNVMCELSGINSFEVDGYLKSTFSGGPHAWNMVEIDGQYLFCDPTNSDNYSGHFFYNIDELFGKNFDSKFNTKDLNYIGAKYQEYSYDNYDFENQKFSKDDKKNEKEIVAKNSTVLNREESKYNDMLNNYKKSDKFDKIIDKIIEKKNQVVNSIDLTSENAINVYKYLMLSLGVGSAILLGKKSKDKIEKNIKENKIKKEKVKPVRVKKDFLDKIKVAKKQKELKKEQSEIKEKENVVFNNPKIDSKNEPTFENNVDYYNELKQSIDYMLQVEKNMTNNSFVINKTLDEELEYYLSTMNMSPQERALTSLVRDSILPYEIPIEKMTQVQRDSLKAQIRLEQNISLCIKELQEQGYEINTSIKRA